MPTDVQSLSPVAANVIKICGGYERVAQWLGLNLSTVYRFTYSRADSGTGGLIPAKYQAVLLTKARRAGIDLRSKHFFEALPVRRKRKRALSRQPAVLVSRETSAQVPARAQQK